MLDAPAAIRQQHQQRKLSAMLIRATRLFATLPRIAKGLRRVDKDLARPSNCRYATPDAVATAELPPHALAPGVRPSHCMRCRHVAKVDGQDHPAMQLQ